MSKKNERKNRKHNIYRKQTETARNVASVVLVNVNKPVIQKTLFY